VKCGQDYDEKRFTMLIEIDTHDRQMVGDLMETANEGLLEVGYQRSVPGGGVITYQGTVVRKSFGVPETISLLLTVGGSVTINLISSWLYDKLKGRTTTLRIDRKEINLEKGEITRIIEEKMEKRD
jgi:hypothetical protein